MLHKSNSVTVHHRNLRSLTTEIYKVIQGLSPPLLNEVCMSCQCIYDLCGNKFLERQRVKSMRYDTESISFLTLKVWGILPNGK